MIAIEVTGSPHDHHEKVAPKTDKKQKKPFL